MCLYKKAFALIFSAAVCFDLLLQDSATSSLPPNVTEGKKEAAADAAEPCAGIPADKQHQQSCPHIHGLKPTPSALLSPAGGSAHIHTYTHTYGPDSPLRHLVKYQQPPTGLYARRNTPTRYIS